MGWLLVYPVLIITLLVIGRNKTKRDETNF